MSVSKDMARDTWYVRVWYTAGGKRRERKKRGFRTKREAIAWEENFKKGLNQELNMPLSDFVDTYFRDISPRLKPTSMQTKTSIINRMILPYLGSRNISEITPADIVAYINSIYGAKRRRDGIVSDGYVRAAIQALKAIFSHACKFYNLMVNPCQRVSARDFMRPAPPLEKNPNKKKKFWLLAEYEAFISALRASGAEPCYICVFEILYWGGLRVGELLALSAADFDLASGTLSITKNFQHTSGINMVLSPKTRTSIRTIDLPEFLAVEIGEYIDGLQPLDMDARIFDFSTGTLRNRLSAAAKAAGLKPITLHGYRHSHVSLLTSIGTSLEQIAYRLGHTAASMTALYAHPVPAVQKKIAARLNNVRQDGNSKTHPVR